MRPLAEAPRAWLARWLSAPGRWTLAELRLASGLVLMAFTAGHLANHALTHISLDAVQTGRSLFLAIWRSVPGTLLLYGALLGHVGMVLYRLYERRSLRLPPGELLQIVLGIAIPFWLVIHVVSTRGVHERFGFDDSYLYQFARVWPNGAGSQLLMLLLVWVHGCLGIHFWLKVKPWYPLARPWLLGVGVLLPALAISGFELGGREVRVLAQSTPGWLDLSALAERWPDQAARAWAEAVEHLVLLLFVALVALALAGRGARWIWQQARFRVRVRYPGGAMIAVMPGTSVLEASRLAGIPHAAVCGGRGRCSTCRIRIVAGQDQLRPPYPAEERVLARIGAAGDVRLACQVRPEQDLAVVPLLPAAATVQDGRAVVRPSGGVEREVVVLFADLRAFTHMAEGRLPYDVVFILNQYFKATGEAIEAAGGQVDKFIGDGLMALFGIDTTPEQACRQALAACRAMAENLALLNRQIAQDLPAPLQIGIGLHVGPVILGQMGYGKASSLTAIGDTVNVAARLEELTKEFQVEVALSALLARRAGVELSHAETGEIDLRGRQQPLQVLLVQEASMLPALPLMADMAEPDRQPPWRRRLAGRLAPLRGVGRP